MTHLRLMRFGVLLLCIFSFFAYALPKTAYAATETVKAVSNSAGGSTCAIMTDGSLKCWGNNSFGQLGYDDLVDRGGNTGDVPALAAVNLGTGRTVKMISTGGRSACAVLDNGTLKCWGFNGDGQLGYDDTTSRGGTAGDMAALGTVFLGVGRTAKAVSVADSVNGSHTCAILDNGKLKCWGFNLSGQLGYDDTVTRGDKAGDMAALGYVDLGAGRTAVSVSTGFLVTCVVLDNGKLKCWGNNGYGQLGYEDITDRGDNPGDMAALNTINLGAGRTARAVHTSGTTTCAILDTKALKCWGDNTVGQLGYEDLVERGSNPGDMAALAPVNLGAGRTAIAVSVANPTCVVLDNKSLKCWGENTKGGLGQDDTINRGGNVGDMSALAAVNLGTGRTAKTVETGGTNTCAILDNNRLKCWGSNDSGQLGQNDTLPRGGFAGSMAALQPIIFTSGGGDGGTTKRRCVLEVPENTWMCDLRYSDLSSVDYSSVGWDFSAVDFRYSDMSMSTFRNINFSNSNLAHVNFAYSVLDGVDFSNTNLDRAYLRNTSMRGVISGGIVGADLVLPADWRLVQGFLIGPFANLTNKAINNSNLAGAQLMYAQLAYANLASSQLQGADLSGSDARGADMSYTNLSGATLRWSTVMWSNFSFANLTGANLSGAFLAGANFHGANLSGADLTGADLTGVNWQDTICPDGTNSNTHNQTCVY